MHQSFRYGFEKQSFLQDVYKGSRAPLLGKATLLGAKSRVANTPGVTYTEKGLRDTLKDTWTSWRNKDNKSAATSALNLQGMPATTSNVQGKAGNINVNVFPQKSKLLGFMSRAKRPDVNSLGKAMQNPQGHAAITHHELDEASLLKKTNKPTMMYKNNLPLPAETDAIQKSMSDIAKGYHEKGLRGTWAPIKEGFGNLRSMGKRINAQKDLPQAAHMGPEVILNESNRVFHEMHPEVGEKFKTMRKGNEADIMKRHGGRYGEEYIQPDSRRYRKLVGNMNKTLGAAGGDSAKLFPPKRKGLSNA